MTFFRKVSADKLFSNNTYMSIILLLVLLPVLFIGTMKSHDWGDDFAQYIHQAGNLIQGIPQSETGFVYSQSNYIGPQAYPMGFPILLAPVYYLAGNSISAFILCISVFYIMFGYFLYYFYRNFFSQIAAFLLVLILIYNPQLLLFKSEVMSDIPFTALLVLAFVFYMKSNKDSFSHNLLLALLSGFLLVLRPAGIVFVLAIITQQIIERVQTRQNILMTAQFIAISAFVPLIIYFVINTLLFRIPSGGSINDYLLFYYSGDFLKLIPENFAHHLQVYRYMFEPDSGVLKGFSIILGSTVISFAVIGFLYRIAAKPQIIEWFFVFYVVMLLLFPNNNSGFRLMVPIGFLILFYSASGLKLLSKQSSILRPYTLRIIGLLVLLLYIPGIIGIVKGQNFILEGPQQPNAQMAFEFIKKNIPENEVIVFAKPRALALYANCRSMCDPNVTDPTLIHTEILKAQGKYLLLHKTLTREPMLRYERVMQKRLTRVWANEDFRLFKINPLKHP